jgi:hypothetical protein
MSAYPVRVEARLDEPLSRWLWLVKWLLAIPHYVVLLFLWIAYTVLTVVAFFAILFTGRYPRAIFDFNVGVLRWTWRVGYYSYSALGTDRYPPFTLAEVPDYPATLSIEYPQRLSRGLALVKWWLLAIPHYLIVGIFVGGGYALGWNDEISKVTVSAPGGLITLLVIIAGLAVLILDSYPRGIYDFVVGMNRWALRVAAYASLMTDEYPPFRLDNGGTEPVDRPIPPPTSTPGATDPATTEPPQVTATTAPVATAQASHWPPGRVVSAVLGVLLLLTGIGVTTGGAALAWADSTQRDSTGYLNTPVERYTSDGYALRFDALDIGGWTWDTDIADWLGTVRVRADAGQAKPLFVGVADSRDIDLYLGRTGMDGYRDDDRDGNGRHRGMEVMARPATAPGTEAFWVASTSGIRQQTLTWEPTVGSWTLVVMNSDGSAGVDADFTAGATAPVLRRVGIGLLVGGGIAALAGALLVVLAAVRPAGREAVR